MRVVPTVVLAVSVSMASSEGFAQDNRRCAPTRSIPQRLASRSREPGREPTKDSNVRNVQKCFRTSGMPPVARCRKDSIF